MCLLCLLIQGLWPKGLGELLGLAGLLRAGLRVECQMGLQPSQLWGLKAGLGGLKLGLPTHQGQLPQAKSQKRGSLSENNSNSPGGQGPPSKDHIQWLPWERQSEKIK